MIRRTLASMALASAVAGCGGTPSPGIPEPPIVTGADEAISVLINRSAPTDDLAAAGSCPGILVERRLVLTAAHCVADRPADGLDVVVGGDNLCAPVPIDGDRLPVREIHLHPLADVRRTVDAALLELDEPADAEPLRLGPTEVGDSVVAVGWGRPRPQGPAPCRNVRTELAIVPTDACRDVGRASARAVSNSRHLCAVPAPGEVRNTCTGDSGGPLLAGDGTVSRWSSAW